MRPDEILSTIVEFSVAVAGFSGIVAALAPSSPSQWPFIARQLFSALLFSTAASASIALLVMVLLASPASPATSWATASAVHGAFLFFAVIFRTRQGRRRGGPASLSSYLTLGLLLAMALGQWANALWIQAAWLCIGLLTLYASMGFVYFIVLVTVLWETSPAARQGGEGDVE